MTTQAIAARYAKALFEVVLNEGDLQTVERELAEFVQLMATHRDLRDALTSPAVPTPKKQIIVRTLVERTHPTPALARLLGLLAARDRLALLPDLLDSYRDRRLDREGVVRGEIVTVSPVTPERVAAIERGLTAATGRRVTLTSRVDPSIGGGLVARVGSMLYDGSVATQLRLIRETLSAVRR